MKVLLGIFCGLMVLFAGGCALLLAGSSGYGGMFQSLPLAFIPAGVAALNVLVLIALFGMKQTHLWAFVVLAILDALVVLITLVAWVSNGFGDSEINVLAALLAGAFAAKGVLTALTAQRLRA